MHSTATDQPIRPLNIFQRVMLQWNRLHAYNAVHLVTVRLPLDADRLGRAIDECCRQAGLTNVELDSDNRRLIPSAVHTQPGLAVLDGRGNPRGTADARIAMEINQPFTLSGPMCPVRFFAVRWGEQFELGLVYCHFIADASPISRLLGLILRVYAGQAKADEAASLRQPPKPLRGALLAMTLKHGLAWAIGAPGHLANLVRSTKPRYLNRLDGDNAYLSADLQPPQLAGLLERARAWGVSLNDVFMAAMAKTLEEPARQRIAPGGRRRLMALSSIADLRPHLNGQAGPGVALLLGSFCVFHTPAQEASLEQVARELSRQSRRARRWRLHVRTLAHLRLSLPIMAHCCPDRQQKFYREHYAQWAGISNINMDASPNRPPPDLACGYRRAVSTGPVCPTVWAVTTSGGRLSISLSYRTTVFGPSAAQACLDRFVSLLDDAARPAIMA